MREQYELKIQNIKSQNLPQISVNGQVTYQSAVPELPVSLPGLGGLDLPQTQFRTYVDVSQSIYTGGSVSALSSLENALFLQKQQQVELQALAVKRQVTDLYFSILEIQNQQKIIEETQKVLEEKRLLLVSALANGVATENELLKLDAQKLSLSAQEHTLSMKNGALREVLSLLLGMEMQGTVLQTEWNITWAESTENKSPELVQFQWQRNTIESQKEVLDIQRMPKVAAFAQSGVGQPNPYNFFNKNVSAYYVVGARLQWNIWDWNKTEREKMMLDVQSEQINLMEKQKMLEIQTKVEVWKKEIENLQIQLDNDIKLIELREAIEKNAQKQYQEGVILFSTYLDELLLKQQAYLYKINHENLLTKYQKLIDIEYGNL